ncbi:MAG TPA: trigger factor [Thermoleophilia bacterium]|nr:trigger factor [Thermoleophilia bacterium]
MKTTITEIEGSKVRLDVEVPAEEVGAGLERTLHHLSQEIKLPGFRKGKVPTDLVLQRFGMEAVVREMLEEELPKWYAEALQEAEIVPVGPPEVDFEQAPSEQEAFTFQAEVPVMPTPKLGEFKGLEVLKEEPTVEDDEVNRQVERLRDEFAELRPVEGRPAQEGDFVTVDFQGRLDGEEVDQTSAEDYVLQVGSNQLLPDLEQGVVGMEPDQEKVISAVFPEEYPAEDIAGKTLDFTVKLKEVKEKSLPEMNDEFAEDVSEFETLLELRLDIRKKLQSSLDQAADRRYRNAAVKRAADNAQLELPDAVIDEQANDMVQDFAHSLTHQGTSLEHYLELTGSTMEALLAEVRPQAEDSVRTTLVLDSVAEAEGLVVTDGDLDGRLEEMAQAAQMESEEFRSRLEDSGRISTVRQQLLREMAADLIVDNAVPVKPEPEPEPSDDDERTSE